MPSDIEFGAHVTFVTVSVVSETGLLIVLM